MDKLRNATTHLRSTHQLQPLNHLNTLYCFFLYIYKKYIILFSTNKGVICVISNKSNFNKVNISQIIENNLAYGQSIPTPLRMQGAFEKGDAQCFFTGKHMIFIRNAFGIQHALNKQAEKYKYASAKKRKKTTKTPVDVNGELLYLGLSRA